VLQALIEKTTTGILLANEVQQRHSLEYTVTLVWKNLQGERGTDLIGKPVLASVLTVTI
jgi:hypothetical protein